LQDDLTTDDYKGLMMNDLEDLHCHWLRALENIESNKLRIAKQYKQKELMSKQRNQLNMQRMILFH
jgi:hypothetical protein